MRRKTSIATIVALLGVAFVRAQDDPISMLEGIGMANTASYSGVNNLSMAGGAHIVIKGLPPNDVAGGNVVKMESLYYDGTIMDNSISPDDEFNSNPLFGKLAFTTPSVMDLFAQDFDRFNGEFLINGYDP